MIAVLDFETTGLSPAMGDRATEVAIVLVEGGRVVDRFQSLMNAGVRIPAFIEAYTGITNEMIDDAPPAEEVMDAARRFVGEAPMVAHNAAFDRRFWEMEVGRLEGAGPHLGPPPAGEGGNAFACTLLVSRRLWPEARSFRLGSLAAFHGIEFESRAHRAMSDCLVTAKLLGKMERELERRWDVFEMRHELLVTIGKTAKKKVPEVVQRWVDGMKADGAQSSATPAFAGVTTTGAAGASP